MRWQNDQSHETGIWKEEVTTYFEDLSWYFA